MSVAKMNSKQVDEILDKALSGERLSLEDGLILYEYDDLIKLGAAAKQIKQKLHPDNLVTFTVNRNINYTNVCDTYCRFCAFYRPDGHKEAYVLPDEVILEKVRETVEIGGDESEILMQGGTHPGLPFSYYTNLLHKIKEQYNVIMHSFSAAEIWKMVEVSELPLEEVIRQLKEAGLDSIPGGGAEILDDRTRMRISKRKESWVKWMEVHDMAHRLGMHSTATMVIGFGETNEERLLHMIRVREQQDKTKGFTAFISWVYQPDNTALKGTRATSVEYLKNLAISRLMVDNIKNLQASWVTMGPKIGQLSLEFGCNDMGSTMIEENVVSAAGATHSMNKEQLIRLIRDAGHIPARRNTYYKILETY